MYLIFITPCVMHVHCRKYMLWKWGLLVWVFLPFFSPNLPIRQKVSRSESNPTFPPSSLEGSVFASPVPGHFVMQNQNWGEGVVRERCRVWEAGKRKDLGREAKLIYLIKNKEGEGEGKLEGKSRGNFMKYCCGVLSGLPVIPQVEIGITLYFLAPGS